MAGGTCDPDHSQGNASRTGEVPTAGTCRAAVMGDTGVMRLTIRLVAPLALVAALPLMAVAPAAQSAVMTPRSAGLSAASPKPAVERASTVDGVFSAGGVSQYLHCQGTQHGATVILIAGWNSYSHRTYTAGGSPGGGWFLTEDPSDPAVATATSHITRTCWYDRPGLGRSHHRLHTTYLAPIQHAAELWALLKKAHERGPFIPVGHSYGGLVAQAFARVYGRATPGMVLLESAWAGQGADQLNDWYWPEPESRRYTQGIIDMHRTLDELGYLGHFFGHKPLVVMTMATTSSAGDQVWMVHQKAMARFSSNSQHLIAPNSQHVLQYYVPRAVIKAIADVVWSVRRGGSSMGTCRTSRWVGVGADCV